MGDDEVKNGTNALSTAFGAEPVGGEIISLAHLGYQHPRRC
jgi:hypothetical protein